MALPALPGLRYPVKLLPVVLFEVRWKPIRLPAVAVPEMRADETAPETTEAVFSGAPGVVVAVVPWGRAWHHYVAPPCARWR